MGEDDNPSLVRANKAVARLIFGRFLGSGHYFHESNIQTIEGMVHYHYDQRILEIGLTLGGLIDQHPEYLEDIYRRVFDRKETLGVYEFLARFLELSTSKQTPPTEKPLRYATLDVLTDAEKNRWDQMVRSFLVRWQIPLDDLLTGLGFYSIKEAEKRGLVKICCETISRVPQQQA